MYVFKPTANPDYRFWLAKDALFTPDECSTIRAVGAGKAMGSGTVGFSGLETRADLSIRKSSVCFIEHSSATAFIFDRLSAFITSANESSFHFCLTGLIERPQLGRYEAGEKYGWHVDNGASRFSTRKLTVSVQLSEPEDYTGGELQLLANVRPRRAPRGLGSAVVFPSYIVHRVAPVVSGVRFSLVAWTSGPAFR